MPIFKTRKKETAETEFENPVYSKGSAGEVKTFSVSGREAAMVMAIVADQTEIPLNQLKFISIKEVTE